MIVLHVIGVVFKGIFGTRPAVPGRCRVLWLSRYTLASMVLGTVPLLLLPQGRDIVVALADDGPTSTSVWFSVYEHRFFFYVTLSLWALSVWYWSRVVLDADSAPPGGGEYGGLARHLPRIFGAATLLLPSFPIAAATNGLPEKIAMIGGCVALTAAFWIFVSKRRDWFSSARGPAVDRFSVNAAMRTPAGVLAAVSLTISVALFLVFVFRPLGAADHLGGVAILFIAAANTVFLGNAAVFLSQTSRIRLDLVALTLAALFGVFDLNDNHAVEVQPLALDKPLLEERFAAWQAQRPSAAPVFLAAAEGGGIRAAYWTATVLGGLSEAGTEEFGQRLFAVSGISGGTLGATVYAALRHDHRTDLRQKAQTILSHDFLSPILAKLVSGDLLQWFLPRPVRAFDRSTAIEDAFVRAYDVTGTKGTLSGPLTTLMPDATTGVPALVMNTTIVESGGRAAIAPFTWTDAQIPEATNYICWVSESITCDGKIYGAPPIVKAVHNSARFTYVSPAGRVLGLTKPAEAGKQRDTGRHVVDGGYFDPTGVDTLLDLSDAIRPLPGGGSIVHVYVTNETVPRTVNRTALGEAAKFDTDAAMQLEQDRNADAAKSAALPAAKPDVPNDTKPALPMLALGELFRPVQALLGTRAAHGLVAIGRQRHDVLSVTFGFCPLTEKSSGEWEEKKDGTLEENRFKPPLGWQLSAPTQRRLNAYWTTCDANKDGVAVIRALLKAKR